MTNVADFIIADARNRLDAAYASAAGMMAGRLNEILSVQAPLEAGVFPPRAATRAVPGAIPRRVSGYLQSQTGFAQISPGQWVFGIRSGPFYAIALETEMNHPFFRITIDAMLPAIISDVSDQFRRVG